VRRFVVGDDAVKVENQGANHGTLPLCIVSPL
jgi:hypothetical protein